jgi:hypothetical protein
VQQPSRRFSLPAQPVSGSRRTERTNPVTEENRLAGTPDWRPSRYLFDISGYASATSVAAGDTLTLYVDSDGAGYDLNIYRTGYYGGAGGRLVETVSGLRGVRQPAPLFDFATGLASCSHWSPSHSLGIPEAWLSGIYVAKLRRSDTGGESYILFVVRDDARPADLLYQQSVTTYQAYNGFGGKSLYSEIGSATCSTVSGAARAVQVSFNRPYNAPLEDPSQYLRAEYPMVYWLEAQGCDVIYSTNLDTHRSGLPGVRNRLLECRAFLSVGHDEYWSQPMRDAVTQARDAGVHLGFFSANTCYWRVRFEPDPWTGAPDRTMVCYKTTEGGPPDPSGHPTTTWRDAAGVNDPEDSLIGVQYIGDNDYGYFPLRITAELAQDQVFRNTGLQNLAPGTFADIGRELCGWEWDAVPEARRPANLTILARSPVYGAVLTDDGNLATRQIAVAEAHTTRYRAPGGAYVFAAGTIQWSWGLALMEPDERLQQITYNVLADMDIHPAAPADTLVLDGERPASLPLTSGTRRTALAGPTVSDIQVETTDVTATFRWRTDRAVHAQLWLGHDIEYVNEVLNAPLEPAFEGQWTLTDLEPGSTHFFRLAVWDEVSALTLTATHSVVAGSVASLAGARRWVGVATAPAVCQARPVAQPAWNWVRDNPVPVVAMSLGIFSALGLAAWRNVTDAPL